MLLSSVHLLVPVLVTFYSRHHFLTPPSLYRTSTHSSIHPPTHTHTHTSSLWLCILLVWYTAVGGNATRTITTININRNSHSSRRTTITSNTNGHTLHHLLRTSLPTSHPSTPTISTSATHNLHPRRLWKSKSPHCLQSRVCSTSQTATNQHTKQVRIFTMLLFLSMVLMVSAVGQSPKSQSQSQSQHPSPQLRQEQQPGISSMAGAKQQPESRSEQQFSSTIVSHPRMTLPPTPPMHPDSVVDGNQSPSSTSTHSGAGSYYLGQSLNNMEPHQQRQIGAPLGPVKRTSIPQSSMSPYSTSSYAPSPYTSSPGAASAASFYSPEPHPYQMGMYGQRSLPSNFQPQMPLPVPTPSGNGSNPWQHHHYISTSSQSAFPQSQDRYICSTCNKAFSRPSSLRIHSHSHTGEKPYKCPQPGCGKAFSVRSNMKRHERGCHASTTLTT